MRGIIAALPLLPAAMASFPSFPIPGGLGGLGSELSSIAAEISSLQNCLTEYGTVSRSRVSTSTATTTVQDNIVVSVTVQATATVTPLLKTKYLTVTHTPSTTSKASGSTVTVTATDKINKYTTVYQNLTVSHTNTIVTMVPTPAGFLQIANTTSTYPGVNGTSSSSVSSSGHSSVLSVSSSGHSSVASTSSASHSSVHSSAVAVSAKAQVSVAASVHARSEEAAKKMPGQHQSFANVVSCFKSIIVPHTSFHTRTAQPTTVTAPASTVTVYVTVTAGASAAASSTEESAAASSTVYAAAASSTVESAAASSTIESAAASSTVYAAAATSDSDGSAATTEASAPSAAASSSAAGDLEERGLYGIVKQSVTTKTVTTSVYVPITTTTYTSTMTAQVSTTVTSYAACATANQLGPYLVNGNAITGISSVSIGEASLPKSTFATDATQCCELCMKLGDCTASGFIAETKTLGLCYLYTSSTCAAQSENELTYTTQAGVVSKMAMTIGNGVCGYLEKKN